MHFKEGHNPKQQSSSAILWAYLEQGLTTFLGRFKLRLCVHFLDVPGGTDSPPQECIIHVQAYMRRLNL